MVSPGLGHVSGVPLGSSPVPASPTPHALLSSLFAQQLDAIVVTDPRFVITEYAGAAERLFGWSADEARGHEWFVLMPTTLGGPAADETWARIRGDDAVEADARVRRKDGSDADVHLSLTPVRDGAGAPAGWLGVIRERVSSSPSKARPAESRERDSDRFDLALEGAGVGVFEADLETRTALRSPELIRMLGGDPATFPTAIDVMETRIHPEDLVQRRKDIAALQSTGRVRAEYRVRHEDGHWMWFAVRWTVTARDAEGRSRRIAGVVADITRQKLIEGTLRAREASLRAFFDSPAVGVIVSTASGLMAEVNDRACEIVGYPREELVEKTWQQLTHPDDLAIDEAEFHRLTSGQIDHYAIDKRYVRKDGSIVWCLLSVSCVRAADGRLDLAVAIIKDITDRKRAERKLSESEALLRTVIDHASDAIHLFDLQRSRVTVMNPRYAELTGYSEEEMRSMTPADAMAALHPEDRERLVEHLRGQIANPAALPEPIEYRWRTKHGDTRWVRSIRTVVRDDTGAAIGLVGVSHDVTERKQAEEAIRSALAHNADLVALLRQRISARTLADVLPICMYCKQIRDDAGRWDTLEHYIASHTDSLFSHGLCPSCVDRFLAGDDEGAPPAPAAG